MGESKSAFARKRFATTRSKKRWGVFYKRLLPKKFRSGEERREETRGRNGVGEKEGREKERATINVDVFLRPLGRRNVCSGKCNHAVI